MIAQEQNGWQRDSLLANSDVVKPDAQQVYEVLLKMLDRWNAHDMEGYMEVYWMSPELLVIVDSEQFNGWQQLMILTSTVTRIAIQWGLSNLSASKLSCYSQILHLP